MDLEQRKAWNGQHKLLTGIILRPSEHARAVELFLHQHAWLYASKMSNAGFHTFEDAVMEKLEDRTFRAYPVQAADTKNSIAWHLWHLARIEDMTMNILVAGGQQVLHTGNWPRQLNIRFLHSGNAMGEGDVAELSSRIDREALLEYRVAVGRQTRRMISSLEPGAFKEKVRAERIQRLFEEGAVLQEASGIADYWSNKTVGGLVLMPATRHHLLHLNKCARIRQKLQKR